VTSLRRLAVLFAISPACATAEIAIEPFIDHSKADGPSIKLRLEDRHRIDVDEPSDLAVFDGQLYTVSDRHSKIYRLSHDGDIQDELDVTGTDIEAIAFDADGTLFFAEESSGTIWRADSDGDRHDPIELVDDQRGGLEGLAFDDRGHLFVAKEKHPARIYELEDGRELDRDKIEFAGDLSALAFDPEDGQLYALSDQERTLFRLDRALEVDKAWKLPVDHPEGIAFDGDTLYVVSDSEERLYVFEIER
jgi:uncharacterized protein YjiK